MSNPLQRLSDVCQSIETILTGQAAAAVLRRYPVRTSGTIVVLPSWVWLVPKIDVGRKSVTADGEKRLMPVRSVWTPSPLQILHPAESTTVTERTVGLGYDRTSEVTLVGGPTPTLSTGSPVRILPFTSQDGMDAILQGLAGDGEDEKWKFIASFEPFTKSKVLAADAIVASELGQYTADPASRVIDDITVDELVNTLLFGSGGSSVVSRMADRALLPETFRRVDPVRYFAVGIAARAEEEVRRKIGDPKIGPKVRRLLAKTGATTIEELIAAYRIAYPNDALARKRALAALTAGPELAARPMVVLNDA